MSLYCAYGTLCTLGTNCKFMLSGNFVVQASLKAGMEPENYFQRNHRKIFKRLGGACLIFLPIFEKIQQILP